MLRVYTTAQYTRENKSMENKQTKQKHKNLRQVWNLLVIFQFICFFCLLVCLYSLLCFSDQFSSVTQSCPTLCDPMNGSIPGLPVHHQLLGVYSNSFPLSQWCHPTNLSSIFPFSSRLQYSSASGSFQMSQFFTSGGQSIGVSASASVLPMDIQDLFPLGWTGWTC